MLQRVAVLFVACFSLSSLLAQPVPLTNPDFDVDALLEGEWSNTVTGWQVSGNAGFFNPTETQYPTDDGTRANIGYTNNGRLIQVTGEPLALDTEYTLNLEAGHRADTAQAPFTVRLVADGQVLAQAGGYTINPGEWRPVTLKLITSAAHPIGAFLEIHLISTDVQTNYDNVTLTIGDAPVGGPGGSIDALITEDTTLNVPADFPGIQEALDFLGGRTIVGAATVTIQVADGVYANLSTITVDHPDGRNIHVIGNTADASQCVLQFPSNGILIDNGRGLGKLDGFRVEVVDRGVSVANNSFLNIGEAIEINGGSHGLLINGGSRVRALAVKISNCGSGVSIGEGAYIFIGQDWVIENCNTGINAQNNGTLGGSQGTLRNNTLGAYASIQGVVFLGGTVITGNGQDFSAAHHGSISYSNQGTILTIP
jgi:hypothetical protein